MPGGSDAWAIAQWDAVETASRLARREVSTREVTEAAIARAEDAAHLGAIVATTFDRARAAATSKRRGRFAGVPTFVKDLSHVRGVPIGWGSAAAGSYTSWRSDPFVTRLEKTGVVVLGKSATPELGLTATTEPLGRAPARNPWDPSRSAGGSSGGAAVLVAAGVVPFAHGSDGGGSIRIPAACCGLVGLKPSRSRIDMEGSSLLPVNVAVHGVLSRTVRDTVAFHRALAGLGEIAPEPRRRLRIGVFVDAPAGTKVHPDVQAAVSAAGRSCRELGHDVDEIRCPFDRTVTDDFLAYWGLVAWVQIRAARVLLHRGFDTTKVEPWTVGLTRSFEARPAAASVAIVRLRRFARTYAETMRRYDVLVCPTVASPAPPIGELATDLPYEEALERARNYAPFTSIQNIAGAPAISLPLGRAGHLPIGVQFAAARGEDARLLELARSLESAFPWPTSAPRSAWEASKQAMAT